LAASCPTVKMKHFAWSLSLGEECFLWAAGENSFHSGLASPLQTPCGGPPNESAHSKSNRLRPSTKLHQCGRVYGYVWDNPGNIGSLWAAGEDRDAVQRERRPSLTEEPETFVSGHPECANFIILTPSPSRPNLLATQCGSAISPLAGFLRTSRRTRAVIISTWSGHNEPS
jgi:hypothetical protein